MRSLLFRYTDYLAQKSGDPVKIFQRMPDHLTEQDELGNEKTLEWHFLAHCTKRSQQTLEEKCRILKPLLEVLEKFRSRFFQFFMDKKFLPQSYVYTPYFFFLLASNDERANITDLNTVREEDEEEEEEEEVEVEDEENLDRPQVDPEPQPGPSTRISPSPPSPEQRKKKRIYTKRNQAIQGTSPKAKAVRSKRYYQRLKVRAASSDENERAIAQGVIERQRERMRKLRAERSAWGVGRSPRKKTKVTMSAYRQSLKKAEEDFLMLAACERDAAEASEARKNKADAEMIRRIQKCYRGSLFGKIEHEIDRLLKTFLVFGYNAEVCTLVTYLLFVFLKIYFWTTFYSAV